MASTVLPSMAELIAHIEKANQIARLEGLEKTSYMLEMAWIDAVARAHNVSEEELETFFFALESQVRVTDHMLPPQLRESKRRATGR